MKRFTWIAIGLTLFGCAGLLYTYTRTPSASDTPSDTSRPNSQGVPALQTTPLSPPPVPAPSRPRRSLTAGISTPATNDAETLEAFEQTEFYRTIVENNLFLPLGTAAAKQPARYRLIATTTSANGDSRSTALIQSIAENETHVVTIGSKVGEVTIVDIQPKQVAIETDGKQTTLELDNHLWLGPSR